MTDTITWQTVEDVPALQPGEIHLWWQDLHTPRLDLEFLEGLLNERERDRVARFKVENVKREFMAARAVVKVLLARYLGCDPDELKFRYGPLGKPSIPPVETDGELCFNYTDAGGFALYAFAWNRELGVDLEALSREVRFQRIIERRFAPRESEALLAVPEPEQHRAFLACWTRKEGYGKALGVGIHFPLDCRELCLNWDSSPLSVTDHIDGDDWDIHQIYPTGDFVSALVHPSGDHPQRYLRLAEIL